MGKKYFTADLSKIFNFKQEKKPHNALYDCFTIAKCINNSLKKIIVLYFKML